MPMNSQQLTSDHVWADHMTSKQTNHVTTPLELAAVDRGGKIAGARGLLTSARTSAPGIRGLKKYVGLKPRDVS